MIEPLRTIVRVIVFVRRGYDRERPETEEKLRRIEDYRQFNGWKGKQGKQGKHG